MKKIILFILTLTFFSCQGQNKTEKKNGEIKKDTIKPKTNIQVHKEYDENGNLISIDSTYTYFYSNIKGDSLLEKDFYKKFKSNFSTQLGSLDSVFMNNFFGKSPFKEPNFYTDDFFESNFKNHQKRIQKMLKRMDSLKNNYYKKQQNLKQL
ncbi:hypothetical protein JL193_16445 [Polaribacter batillariae]|uniref:Lipoprotein n=1 Tax=Polaribacter batillariae TaxID=2808900 RepID=A0ABX7SUQ6_9FLAO|nr:hypothetical protein [Polaribacter batillariae]QTD37632.1 hypothetical protein JL193_16445 [Polaribacter batillariae]